MCGMYVVSGVSVVCLGVVWLWHIYGVYMCLWYECCECGECVHVYGCLWYECVCAVSACGVLSSVLYIFCQDSFVKFERLVSHLEFVPTTSWRSWKSLTRGLRDPLWEMRLGTVSLGPRAGGQLRSWDSTGRHTGFSPHTCHLILCTTHTSSRTCIRTHACVPAHTLSCETGSPEMGGSCYDAVFSLMFSKDRMGRLWPQVPLSHQTRVKRCGLQTKNKGHVWQLSY